MSCRGDPELALSECCTTPWPWELRRVTVFKDDADPTSFSIDWEKSSKARTGSAVQGGDGTGSTNIFLGATAGGIDP
jgi:hypothetical protein